MTDCCVCWTCDLREHQTTKLISLLVFVFSYHIYHCTDRIYIQNPAPSTTKQCKRLISVPNPYRPSISLAADTEDTAGYWRRFPDGLLELRAFVNGLDDNTKRTINTSGGEITHIYYPNADIALKPTKVMIRMGPQLIFPATSTPKYENYKLKISNRDHDRLTTSRTAVIELPKPASIPKANKNVGKDANIEDLERKVADQEAMLEDQAMRIARLKAWINRRLEWSGVTDTRGTNLRRDTRDDARLELSR